MPSRSHPALRPVAAQDRQPSTGCPLGRDVGRVQRGTAGRLSVGSAHDAGRLCTSPYRELAPRTEDTRGLPCVGMYYRDLLTTRTSERAAPGSSSTVQSGGGHLACAHSKSPAVVERDRLVLLAEHDPETKEDPIPPMGSRRSLGGLLGQATELKHHTSKPKICSAVASSVRSMSSSRDTPPASVACSRRPHTRQTPASSAVRPPAPPADPTATRARRPAPHPAARK